MSALEKELATYKSLLPTLKADEGKFALIEEEDALNIGCERCGLKPFLVKRIEANESVAFFSRDLDTLCPAKSPHHATGSARNTSCLGLPPEKGGHEEGGVAYPRSRRCPISDRHGCIVHIH